MTGVLYDGLDIILNKIKILISYFWQPSMDLKHYKNNNNNATGQSSNQDINVKKCLDLENIMVLLIGSGDDVMGYITMPGICQYNYGKRVAIGNSNLTEISIISEVLQENKELRRKQVEKIMSEEKIREYNHYLSIGMYSCCLSMLEDIEYNVNMHYATKRYQKKISKK